MDKKVDDVSKHMVDFQKLILLGYNPDLGCGRTTSSPRWL